MERKCNRCAPKALMETNSSNHGKRHKLAMSVTYSKCRTHNLVIVFSIAAPMNLRAAEKTNPHHLSNKGHGGKISVSDIFPPAPSFLSMNEKQCAFQDEQYC